jgi:seryl-tRNA synthetase
MLDIIIWSAGGLAVATVGVTLYGVGMAHRFQRVVAMREALEARCANLRSEVESREALEQEITMLQAERAKVGAERTELQRARDTLQREIDHVRENAERKANTIAESLVVQHLAKARKVEQEAIDLMAKAEAAFKKTTEPRWVLSQSYKIIHPNTRWEKVHEMAEARLKAVWKEKPNTVVRLVSRPDRWAGQVSEGVLHFEGQSIEEWNAYRKMYDAYKYIEACAFFSLFQRLDG